MKIVINLDVRNYNGGPKLKIRTQQETLFVSTITERGLCTLEFDTDMQLPNKLFIEHVDKDMKRDTKVQSDGKILDDKGFFINSVKLDDVLLINELFYFDLIKDDGEVMQKNNYMGYNGRFVVDLDKKDLYTWYSGWQKILASDQEVFSYESFRQEIFSDEAVERKMVY